MNLTVGSTLEVGGGIANPYVAAAMGIWLALVLMPLLPLAAYMGRRLPARTGVATAIATAVALLVPGYLARALIGSALYRRDFPHIRAAVFSGVSAVVLTSVIAAIAWLAVFVWAGRRAAQPPPN